jgi:pyruvate/2-oxoglutarate dehydrogenase complex dihydrolipoamide acyltransferase (E2) component
MYRNLGPAVRTLLEQYHLQFSQIPATGRKGKLLKGDVLKYITDNKLKPKAPKEGNLTNEMFCHFVFDRINPLSVLLARRILHCSG